MLKQNTPSLLIVGYGNPLRRDDGAGAELVRQISNRYGNAELMPLSQLHLVQGIGLITCHQLSSELCEHLLNYHTALFIDASVAIEKFNVEHIMLPCDSELAYSSHNLTPRQLAMLCTLTQPQSLLSQIHVMHLPAVDMGVGEGFTEAMSTSIAEGLRWVEAFVDTMFHHTVH